MKLHYYNKVGDVPLFGLIRKLMADAYGSESLDMKEAPDLLTIKALEDPVRDFIDYYFDEQGIPSEAIDKSYIVNRLYAMKGGLGIFDVMRELLSVPPGAGRTPISFDITCNYDFPDLELLAFSELKTTDINMFVDKLFAATYVLLFYDKIKVVVEHLYQLICGVLERYILVSSTPYTIIQTRDVDASD